MSTLAELSIEEQQLIEFTQQSLKDQQFNRLILSKYMGSEADLEKISFRLIMLKEQPILSALYHYKTKDITKNYALSEAKSILTSLLNVCKQANLFTRGFDSQLKKTKKKVLLSIQEHSADEPHTVQAAQVQHNREKLRYIEQSRPFLRYLGITDQHEKIIPSMARKWKQINKFIEIFSHAFEQIQLTTSCVRVVDFGSGKGYLTFALYDFLCQNMAVQPYITGVELRANLVDFCKDVAEKVGFEHLDFFEGDVRTYEPKPIHSGTVPLEQNNALDIMIALHACDIATDFAIHTGIRLNASMIMCAPCCHKELRPQLHSPTDLAPMLQFGIHAGQQAEMLTDTIRALLLKAYGYEVKVFEFISLEHTSKNKMILATKKTHVEKPDAIILEQVRTLKQVYGIQQHTLELLLQDQLPITDIGCKC